jgi:hypothetical protein
MNRKSFLKTLGGIFALPFVTPAMTVAQQTLDKMPKPVQKQTKIEQETLKNFYTETEYSSGVFMFSGSCPSHYLSGKLNA